MSHRLRRRAFLAGAGTLIALPFLEAELAGTPHASADPASPAAPPVRFMTFHFPAGVNREAWRPSGTETSWTLGTSQAPLAPHKNDICVLRNVDNSGDHSGSAHTGKIATFLTAGNATKASSAMDTSADQLIAASLVGKTPFRSLELGTAILRENPNAEAGWSPVLKDHLSWASGTPLPKEVNPSSLFDRLFSSGGDGNPQASALRRSLQHSVLDAVRSDAARLKRRLGQADNRKVDQYLTGVRELELRIDATSGACAVGARPGPPADVRERVRQMLDLSVLAFKCDLTRVITFGYEHTVTEQTHPWLGVNDGYHIGVTHNKPGAPYIAVNTWVVSQLAYLLQQLKSVPEGSGTLLDNTIVYFASEMADGTTHSGSDLPIIVGGRGGGRITPGRLLDRPGQGNGNVLIALMRAMGVSVSSFGEGFTTPIPGLVRA